MPVIIAALLGGLIEIAKTLVGRVLIAIGFSYMTYTGLDTSLSWIRDQIAMGFGGLPAQALAVLSAAQCGTALSIVLSGVSARMLLDGLTGGAVKKLVMK